MKMFNENALKPSKIITHPIQEEYLPSGRRWQGIPSLEVSSSGRLFSVFYSGGVTEQVGNFVVLAVSDDDGKTWEDPFLIIRNEDTETIRNYDPNIWIDPSGRLWVFWAQSSQYYDGRCGVWAIICDNPDAPLDQMVFTEPRRIANGIMMNKPTVLKSGRWLLPCALWACYPNPPENHEELKNELFSNVYASDDMGATFFYLGSADVPNRNCDEHMVVEQRDGVLRMLVRRYDGIGHAFSYDGGITWWQGEHSGIPGPCTRFFIRRLKSGNLLLVYHFNSHNQTRNNLMAKISFDDGKTWVGGLMLDSRDNVSYPDGTETSDRTIYIAYDRERYNAREILFAKFTEKDVLAGELVNPNSKLRVLISKAEGELPIENT